jgi:hypothetical protein
LCPLRPANGITQSSSYARNIPITTFQLPPAIAHLASYFYNVSIVHHHFIQLGVKEKVHHQIRPVQNQLLDMRDKAGER